MSRASGRNKVTGGGVSERVAREGRVRQGDADASRREDAADDGASEKGILQGEASEQNDIAARIRREKRRRRRLCARLYKVPFPFW